MADYRYTEEHAWVLEEGDRVRMGLSPFARSELGEITAVELPEIGKRVRRADPVCVLDSLKSASELYAPCSGEVVEVNERLLKEGGCALIDNDPQGAGWILTIKVEEPGELAALMDEREYGRFCQEGSRS